MSLFLPSSTRAVSSQRLEPAQREALYFDLLQDTKGYAEAALFAAQFLGGFSASLGRGFLDWN